MSLTVTNKTKMMFVLNLPADLESEDPALQASDFSMNVSDERKDGTVERRLHEKKIGATLSLLPGETRSGLPMAISLIPEFKRARSLGHIAVVQRADPPPPVQTETPQQRTPTTPPPRGNRSEGDDQ